MNTSLQDPCKKTHEEEDLPSEDGKSVELLLQNYKFKQWLYTVNFPLNRVCTVQETYKTSGKGTVELEAWLY